MEKVSFRPKADIYRFQKYRPQGVVTPRSTKLNQNLLIYQGFFLWAIPSPTLGPTLYCCLIGDLGCVFVVKAGAINDSCQVNQELD